MVTAGIARLDLLAEARIYSGVDLARAATGTLARDDHALHQQFAAPDAPGLSAPERTGQAADPGPASPAQRLCLLRVLRGLGEEQLRFLQAGKISSHRDLGGRSAAARIPLRVGHHLIRTPITVEGVADAVTACRAEGRDALGRLRGPMTVIHRRAGWPR